TTRARRPSPSLRAGPSRDRRRRRRAAPASTRPATTKSRGRGSSADRAFVARGPSRRRKIVAAMDADARRDARLLARFRVLFAAALAMVGIAELLAATDIVPEPIANIFTPYGFGQFFAMAMLGTFILHLWCGPPWREALAA